MDRSFCRSRSRRRFRWGPPAQPKARRLRLRTDRLQVAWHRDGVLSFRHTLAARGSRSSGRRQQIQAGASLALMTGGVALRDQSLHRRLIFGLQLRNIRLRDRLVSGGRHVVDRRFRHRDRWCRHPREALAGRVGLEVGKKLHSICGWYQARPPSPWRRRLTSRRRSRDPIALRIIDVYSQVLIRQSAHEGLA